MGFPSICIVYVLWCPRGLQAHVFESCPQFECWLGFLNRGNRFLAAGSRRRARLTMAYSRVVAACAERKELWQDPDFPATQTSVFYHQTPPFTFSWRRPKVRQLQTGGTGSREEGREGKGERVEVQWKDEERLGSPKPLPLGPYVASSCAVRDGRREEDLVQNPVFIREDSPHFDIVHGKLVLCFRCRPVWVISGGLVIMIAMPPLLRVTFSLAAKEQVSWLEAAWLPEVMSCVSFCLAGDWMCGVGRAEDGRRDKREEAGWTLRYVSVINMRACKVAVRHQQCRGCGSLAAR
ncbi:Calpain-C [Portunus trituberculatus]|uniref:Calpain-C n=1 Tax=Portunus trituberculatus TaxID=210409 RepID=A0A5B7ELW0_PORTR|nr:Calpain-C [Portunus trituberculatus]